MVPAYGGRVKPRQEQNLTPWVKLLRVFVVQDEHKITAIYIGHILMKFSNHAADFSLNCHFFKSHRLHFRIGGLKANALFFFVKSF